ncbi:TonB-dependent receptor domain-containing protein [Sphingopyxis fribergensis]
MITTNRECRPVLPRRAAMAALLGGASLLGQPALAQAPAADTDAVQESEIIVTGSRLIRSDLTAPSPTTVIGEQDLQLSGNATIEGTLNEYPQLAAGNSSNVNGGGGSGVLTANLRGLGATRTLVLVNGRRFIPANADGLVDLASVPDALVKSVDVITGGASAVYGSDAVAGAVNFVLKRDFEGLEGSYQFGRTFRGDGTSHRADITVGTNFAEDRGNVTLSASFTDRGPVFKENRWHSARPLDTVNGVLVPGGSGSIPGTRIGLSTTQRAQLVGVDLNSAGPCSSLTGIRFGEAGAVLPYCAPEDTFNFAIGQYHLRPLKRTQISGIAHYELTDRVEAYGEVYYINSENSYQQASDSFTPVTPGAGASTFLVPNYATNPILLPAVRQFFINNTALFDPDGDGTAAVSGAGRRADELGFRNYSFERNSRNLTGGLRGDFDIGDKNWRWDVFYQYQRTSGTERAQGTISQTRLSQALNATVNGQGQVVCVDPSRGCVPVSIFGLGTIDPAASAFLTPERVANDRFTRNVAGASLSGQMFDLPAGPVAVALGVEYRKDAYAFRPSPQDIAGEYGTGSQSPISGEYDLKEIFGEIRIPILSDRPFFDTLAIEGAARLSDYSTVGSVFTWKAGGEWAPVDWVRVRGAYNVAIRAPSLNELYSPISTGFTTGVDPCVAARQPTPAQQDLCVLQGVNRADLPTFTQQSTGLSARSGGNPLLREEKSKTYTIGAVISPPFIPRLNLTIDYFNVKVDDAITTINAAQTLTDCFTNLDPSSETCRAITRLTNGQIDFVNTNLSNIGSLRVEGLDVQADYRVNLPNALALSGDGAELKLQAIASWMFSRSTQVVSGQPALECAGYMGGGCGGGSGFWLIPDFKLNLTGTYNSGPVTVRMQGRMVGDIKLKEGVVAAVERAPRHWLFDLSGEVRLNKTVEFFGGIDNLFDKDPPILGSALASDNSDPTVWDVVGRRFFVGGRVRF